MRRTVAVALLATLLASAASAAPPSASGRAVVAGANQVGFELLRRLRRPGSNVFFSPASIAATLGLAHAGARGGTAKQLEKLLRLRGRAEAAAGWGELLATLGTTATKQLELRIANAVWSRKGRSPLLPEYAKRVASTFQARVDRLDFAEPAGAARIINAFVAERTRGMLDGIIDPGALDQAALLVLTNAVYFKAAWQVEFPRRATRDESFKLATGERVKVPLMHLTGSFRHGSAGAVQLLELPYRGGDLSMLIVLPRAADGVGPLLRQLGGAWLDVRLRAMPRCEVDVYLPRFSSRQSQELSRVLLSMGLKAAFEAGRADFSGMDSSRGLFLGQVFHRASVDVSEEGTTAAAATAAVMVAAEGEGLRRPVLFRADRPFVYLIRHRPTGAILFLGALEAPAGAKAGRP